MLMLTVLMAGLFVAPIVHLAVRGMRFWGVRTIIAGLVFAPGLCVTAWLVWFNVTEYVEFYRAPRWALVYFLQGRSALRYLMAISAITTIYFAICLLLEYFPWREVRNGKKGAVRVIEAWRPLVIIQLALMAVAAYVYSYTTLGTAVTNDNLALAERRLNWNLEGLGPNDGLIIWQGTPGLVRFPLLPEAVKNHNYDMVELLVKHGAELNPADWDEDLNISRLYVKNPLYFAVKNKDVEMVDFLVDLGVNPEHGIAIALQERDRELLTLFLEKGASVEFALGVADKKGYDQQVIDELFADYIPKNRLEAGQ